MTPLTIPWPDPPIIAAVIGAGGIAFGAWLTWLASGAREMLGRIDTLESRIGALEAEKDKQARVISAMSSFINRLGQWFEGGMSGRRPAPSELIHAHIDTDPWSPPHEARSWED